MVGLILFLIACCSALPADHLLMSHGSNDLDRDGLADDLEQALLIRFAPRFLVSARDCDVMPARFTAGIPDPRPAGRDGTVYGQVFRTAGKNGTFAEIHYYHLWTRDCGLNGHALDVEHVAALVQSEHSNAGGDEWRALYWYAAAHEGTVCDASNAALAASLGAEENGPAVWVSRGKHASFLSRELCRGRCGVDSCGVMKALPAGIPVNIGELSAPLNGAHWISSQWWSLSAKMAPAFNETVLAQLRQAPPDRVILVKESTPGLHSVVLAGASAMNGVALGQGRTESALVNASNSTDRALQRVAGQVGRSLQQTQRRLAAWLGQWP